MSTIDSTQRATDIQDEGIANLRDRSLDSLSLDEEAALQQLQARRLQQLLDEMDDEVGPVSDEIVRDVNASEWPTS